MWTPKGKVDESGPESGNEKEQPIQRNQSSLLTSTMTATENAVNYIQETEFSINVTSFSSISYCSNSKYWTQKYSQNGNIHFTTTTTPTLREVHQS